MSMMKNESIIITIIVHDCWWCVNGKKRVYDSSIIGSFQLPYMVLGECTICEGSMNCSPVYHRAISVSDVEEAEFWAEKYLVPEETYIVATFNFEYTGKTKNLEKPSANATKSKEILKAPALTKRLWLFPVLWPLFILDSSSQFCMWSPFAVLRHDHVLSAEQKLVLRKMEEHKVLMIMAG